MIRRSFPEWLRDVGLHHVGLTPGRYDRLPSPLQDALCSAHGLVYAWRRGPSAPAERAMRAIADAHFDADRADALVEKRARRILDLARGLPAYVAMAPPRSSGSARDELAAWPLLSKETVRARGDQLLVRPPGGTDVCSVTSGTTGTPVKVWRPRQSYREVIQSRDVIESWFGCSLSSRRAAFTYWTIVPPNSARVWRIDVPERQIMLSSTHISEDNLDSYVRILTRWRPDVLDGAASELAELAAMLRGRGLSLPVRLVVSSSEMLLPSGRELIRSVFGGQITDVYGTSEEVALAGGCPAGSRHIFPNVGLVEAVDADGRRLPPGEPGRLLLTTLTNDLMPLVRYEIGDVGSIDDARSCPCGRTSPVLRELQGRQDDVVITKDGRRISIFAFSLALHNEDVAMLQLVQRKPDSFLVRLKLATDTGAARANLEKEIFTAFDQLIGPDPDRTVDFTYDEPIDRTPGGKIRTVIREF